MNSSNIACLDISRAGLSTSVGKKANRVLGNMSWDQLFERFDERAE